MLSAYLTMYLKYLAIVGLVYTIKKIKPQDEIKRTRKALKRFVIDKKIINPNTEEKAYIEGLYGEKWGCRAIIDISNVFSYEDFEKHSDYLKQLFRAKEIHMENKEGKVFLDIINNPAKDLYFEQIELTPTQLLLGYNMKGEPIVVDMLKTPHIGVQGASNSGKSKGIELGLMNLKGADIVLLNVFEADFINLKRARRINGNENILKYLRGLIDDPQVRQRPLYVVLDELNVLGKDKDINKAIQDVLSQARHFNIYFIALGQSLLKEECKYKQLFNVRVTFRAIDRSTIGAFLGCSVEDTKLLQQEFICYSDSIYRGRTYNYNF